MSLLAWVQFSESSSLLPSSLVHDRYVSGMDGIPAFSWYLLFHSFKTCQRHDMDSHPGHPRACRFAELTDITCAWLSVQLFFTWPMQLCSCPSSKRGGVQVCGPHGPAEGPQPPGPLPAPGGYRAAGTRGRSKTRNPMRRDRNPRAAVAQPQRAAAQLAGGCGRCRGRGSVRGRLRLPQRPRRLCVLRELRAAAGAGRASAGQGCRLCAQRCTDPGQTLRQGRPACAP